MGGSIRLHPKLGLNPHMTVCPRCGKDGPEIVLLGAQNYIYTCPSCEARSIGYPNFGKCPKCSSIMTRDRQIEEWERLPGSICDECRQKQAAAEAVVKDGGVYWRCVDCKSSGALRKCDYSERVRLAHGKGTRYEGPCGVELSKRDCPVCGPNKVVQGEG